MTTHHTTWPMATPPPFTQNAPRSQTMADRVGLAPSSILSQCPWKLAAVPLVLCPFLLLLIRPSPGDGSSFSSSTVRASGTPVFPPPGSLFSLSTFPVTFLTSTMADKPEKVESMEKIVVVRRISSGCRYCLNSPSRIRISIPWPRAMERIPRISNRECPSTITSLSHDSHSV